MPRDPTLDLERALWNAGHVRVAGVDECGRGCLAGPVLAAAVVIPCDCCPLPGVRDSKLLAAAQREELFPQIVRQARAVGLGAASVSEISRLNIFHASHLAMERALRHLGPYDHALIDGRGSKSADLGPHTPIVDGDALCYAVACASIVAKVTRDRLMARLARRYAGYDWEHNVGYGTPEHIAGIRSLGITPLHRRAFGTVRTFLDEQLAAAACADAAASEAIGG